MRAVSGGCAVESMHAAAKNREARRWYVARPPFIVARGQTAFAQMTLNPDVN